MESISDKYDRFASIIDDDDPDESTIGGPEVLAGQEAADQL